MMAEINTGYTVSAHVFRTSEKNHRGGKMVKNNNSLFILYNLKAGSVYWLTFALKETKKQAWSDKALLNTEYARIVKLKSITKKLLKKN